MAQMTEQTAVMNERIPVVYFQPLSSRSCLRYFGST